MILHISTPIATVVNTPIQKIDFEAIDGYYTLLPKHIDFVNGLAPTIVTYTTNNQEYYVACNRGVVVKKGDVVSISTPLAIINNNLDELKKAIRIDFQKIEENRKEVLLSMAKLEVNLAKGLLNQHKGEAYVGL